MCESSVNKKNLLKMANLVKRIPKEHFDMNFFRNKKAGVNPAFSFTCGATGCAIGHCLVLAPNLIYFFNSINDIDYIGWSKAFTGIKNSLDWAWCFSATTDSKDTPTRCAKRIKYIALNGKHPNFFAAYRERDLDYFDYLIALEKFYKSFKL